MGWVQLGRARNFFDLPYHVPQGVQGGDKLGVLVRSRTVHNRLLN